MEARSLLQPVLKGEQEHPVTPALAEPPVADPAAEWDVPGGDLQDKARLGHTRGHWGLTGAWDQALASLCHNARLEVVGGILFPWEVSVPDFKAFHSKVRRELHPIPSVGVQRVTVIKRGKRLPPLCLQPPGRGMLLQLSSLA